MKHKKSKIFLVIILVLLAGLIGARLYLPYWVKDYVNKEINALEGHSGGITDVDIHLWRGAYSIHGLNIVKTGSGIDEPFVAADTIDLSVEWRALWYGKIVAELDFYKVDLIFAKSQTGEGAGWVGLIDAISPFDINRMEVHSGRVAYVDFAAAPPVNLFVNDINARVTNLRNVEERGAALPSDISITGTSIGDGAIDISGNMNILKETPDMDISFGLDEAKLTSFNDYAIEAAGIDFTTGNVGIYGEVAALDGVLDGYVKILATDISLIDLQEDSNPIALIWESAVSAFMEIFENQSRDQFALRIPITGDIKNPERDMWSAFISIFQNAFAGAFMKGEDGTISLDNIMRYQDESEAPQED